MKKTTYKSKSKKGRRRENKESTSRTHERRQQARRISILQARTERGGGIAPRQNNRITKSVTREGREANIIAKEILETNGKTTRREDKTNEKGTRKGNTENDKNERKTKKEDKKGKRKGKGKRQGCPSGTY